MDNINVYILYALPDFDLKTELEKHLATLRNSGLIDIINEEHSFGDVLALQSRLLDRAQIILLLISANFFGETAFYESTAPELQKAMARQEKGDVALIPVILRDYLWQADIQLARLHPLPESGYSVISRFWDSPDLAFFNIASGLQKIADALLQRQRVPEEKTVRVEPIAIAPPLVHTPPNVSLPTAFESTDQDVLAQQLIANAFYALFTRDLEYGWRQILPFLHASIRYNQQQLSQFRVNNYEPAFERIRLYKQPVEIISKKNTGRTSLGALAAKETGQEMMYSIAKKQDLGGMPSFIRVFFPTGDVSSPMISGINL